MNPTRFFEIAEEYIKSRNEELLNIRLDNEYGVYGPMIKSQILVHLNDLIEILDFQPVASIFGFNDYHFIIFGES